MAGMVTPGDGDDVAGSAAVLVDLPLPALPPFFFPFFDLLLLALTLAGLRPSSDSAEEDEESELSRRCDTRAAMARHAWLRRSTCTEGRTTRRAQRLVD